MRLIGLAVVLTFGLLRTHDRLMRKAGKVLGFAPALFVISLLTACHSYPVPILSYYGATVSYLGHPYPGAPYHEGVDIAGTVGDPILAVIGGSVVAVGSRAGDERCGLGVVTRHWQFEGRLIRYCHLSAVAVELGDQVERGAVIGSLGATGNAGPKPHIHWEIRTRSGTEDPLPSTVGCFDQSKSYPADRFILTFPVKC